jgi:hypothetical protein
MRKLRGVGRAVAILVSIAVVLTVVGAAVMLLWNALVPELFHAPRLSYGQALGILILSRLLFGGLRGRPGLWHWRGGHWRQEWQAMTPEERERLRERFARRCGPQRTPGVDEGAAPR